LFQQTQRCLGKLIARATLNRKSLYYKILKNELNQLNIKDLAKEFILGYLSSIRYKASAISETDRGLFPFYWFWPSLLTIYINEANDIAVSIDRRVSPTRKIDIIRIRKRSGRIEESIFPYLDYSKWPAISAPENRHHMTVFGGTWNVIDHPFVTIQIGCEIKFIEIRVEASIKGYPREVMFVWFFTSPNLKYLSIDRAYKDAEEDFWHKLSSVIPMKLDDAFSRRIGEETISLFIQSINRIKEEYHRLITRQDLDEYMLQFFLEKYYFLLNPKRKIEKGKRKIGSFIPDFILEYEDGTKTLIEIQLNRDPIIENGKPSSGLKEAIGQLKNWFGWLKSNDLSNLSKYNGLIVIGRKSSYQKNEEVLKNIISEIIFPVNLITYDDLENSIDYILSELTKVVEQN